MRERPRSARSRPRARPRRRYRWRSGSVATTTRPSRSDIRPPRSALASIGSTVARRACAAAPEVDGADREPAEAEREKRRQRRDLRSRAEPLVECDAIDRTCASSAVAVIAVTQAPASAPTRMATATCPSALERIRRRNPASGATPKARLQIRHGSAPRTVQGVWKINGGGEASIGSAYEPSRCAPHPARQKKIAGPLSEPGDPIASGVILRSR